ncbi:hypothetical protein D3C78_1362070 [compost metagenome]
MLCQPHSSSTSPPASGAKTGATPITRVIRLITRPACCGLQRSRTMATASTAPAQPPRPCMKRQPISPDRLSLPASSKEASV